jgi:hypothetical protein
MTTVLIYLLAYFGFPSRRSVKDEVFPVQAVEALRVARG